MDIDGLEKLIQANAEANSEAHMVMGESLCGMEGRLQERIGGIEAKIPSLTQIVKWGSFGGGVVAAVASLAFWFRG